MLGLNNSQLGLRDEGQSKASGGAATTHKAVAPILRSLLRSQLHLGNKILSDEKQHHHHLCPYCGNNPVPHFLTWYFEFSNTFLGSIRRLMLFNPLSLELAEFFDKLNFSFLAVKFFAFIGIISFQTDIEKCKVSRAKVLWQEAQKKGIEFKELKLFGRTFDAYMASKGGKVIVFSGLPRPTKINRKALDVLDDKVILKEVLLKVGLPAPQGKSVWTWSQAKKIFNKISKPVIVKPRTGSRGRHTTTFIYTEQQLKKAYKIAKQLGFWVIVEEQLFGPVYRGTVINYKVRGVLRGDSPIVVGDGRHTILELINLFNHNKPDGVSEIKITFLTPEFLQRQNLSLSTVLKLNEEVSISEKIGVSYGGSSSEDFDICHPNNIELFEQAARILDDPLIGFDFIIPDIRKSYSRQRCGFIEANTLPFINLHHDPLKGAPQNIAKWVWEMVGFN